MFPLWGLRSRGKACNLIAFSVPCAQAKVADLQEAIHARSKWTRLLALIYSTCSHLLQFLYSFCALKCSVLRKKICVFSSCERAWLFAACQSVSAFAK